MKGYAKKQVFGRSSISVAVLAASFAPLLIKLTWGFPSGPFLFIQIPLLLGGAAALAQTWLTDTE